MKPRDSGTVGFPALWKGSPLASTGSLPWRFSRNVSPKVSYPNPKPQIFKVVNNKINMKIKMQEDHRESA
jgi:hypothetical protein